jgi:hypothetical protein
MTNIMHKFIIYVSIYFCLTCFGLSFSPSSEAGVQLSVLLGMVSTLGGTDTVLRRVDPLQKFYTCLLRWAKRKPETCKAEVNR